MSDVVPESEGACEAPYYGTERFRNRWSVPFAGNGKPLLRSLRSVHASLLQPLASLSSAKPRSTRLTAVGGLVSLRACPIRTVYAVV